MGRVLDQNLRYEQICVGELLGRAVKKVICYFKLKKTAKVNDVDITWDMISLEDAVINVAINNPSEILTVEKQATNFIATRSYKTFFGASARPQKILLHPVSCL